MGLTSVIEKLKFMNFTYEIHVGLYMLLPWEKKLFNTMVLAVIGMASYTTWFFLPKYTQSMISYLGWI